MLSTRDPPQNKRHTWTESEGWKKYSIQMEKTKKKAVVTILISDKINIKTKAIKRDKENHY